MITHCPRLTEAYAHPHYYSSLLRAAKRAYDNCADFSVYYDGVAMYVRAAEAAPPPGSIRVCIASPPGRQDRAATLPRRPQQMDQFLMPAGCATAEAVAIVWTWIPDATPTWESGGVIYHNRLGGWWRAMILDTWHGFESRQIVALVEP